MLEPRSAYGYYGVAGGTTGEASTDEGRIGEYRRMPYRKYKQSYSDCKTVPGSYDSDDKTIEVIIPEGREKPSGSRGEHYHYFRLVAENLEGKRVEIPYKAITYGNALKQHRRFCKQEGYKDLEATA